MTIDTQEGKRLVALYDWRWHSEVKDLVAGVDLGQLILQDEEFIQRIDVSDGGAEIVFAHLKDVRRELHAGNAQEESALGPPVSEQVVVLFSTQQRALSAKITSQAIDRSGYQTYVIVPRNREALANAEAMRALIRSPTDVAKAIVTGKVRDVPPVLRPIFGLVEISDWLVALRILCEGCADVRRETPDSESLGVAALKSCIEDAQHRTLFDSNWDAVRGYCAEVKSLAGVPDQIENLLACIRDSETVEYPDIDRARLALEGLFSHWAAARAAPEGTAGD